MHHELKNGSATALRVVIAVVAAVVIAWFYPQHNVTTFRYQVGHPWNYATLYAPFDLPVRPDTASVNRALDSIAAAFVPVYVDRRTAFNTDSVLAVARRRIMALSGAENAEAFAAGVAQYVSRAYARGLMAGTDKPRRMRMLDGRMLTEGNPADFVTLGALNAYIDSLAVTTGCVRQLQNSGLEGMLQPTVVCDSAENERLLASARAAVTTPRGVIMRGQTIVDRGAIVNEQTFTNLQTYEQMLERQLSQTRRNNVLAYCGHLLFVLLMLTALVAYIIFYQRQVWQSARAFTFILLSVTCAFLVTVGLEQFLANGTYITPLAIVPILVLVFFNGQLALMTSGITIVICAGAVASPLEFIVLETAATAAAVFSLRELTRRAELLRASALVAVTYWLAYLAMTLLDGLIDDFSWRVVSALTISALLTSMAYILMFVIERIFGFVSNVTLVELSDTNNPLLRRLSDECPGTFQHSVSVSNMAAAAARAIGANALLVRAGAMYHDIGKLANPVFFTENQRGVNPHDGLSPMRSAQIITGHVNDGVQLAERAGLPAVISNFIREHHGHGTAKYFYYTYCNQHPDQTVDPEPFQYPGPNPQSRETSLLMMADGVEAASRSLADQKAETITALVNKIIDDQIAQGLHAESNLSFSDVTAIKRSFIERLMTIYHTRITYPDAPQSAK